MAGAVDADSVDDGVGACEVDVFEDVWGVFFSGLDLAEDGVAAFCDDDGFAGVDVAQNLEAELVQCHGFGGHHVVVSLAVEGVSGSQHEGSNAVGIPEADEAVACEHGCAGPSAFATFVHSGEAGEEVVVVDASFFCFVKFVGEDVEH